MAAAGKIHVVLMVVTMSLGMAAAFKIGAFNTQSFGEKKMEDPGILGVLVETIQRYDIILLQEIKDATGEMLGEIREMVNQQSDSRYGMRVSEELGRSKSKQRYAFFFRKDKGIAIDDVYQYDDGEDKRCQLIKEPGQTEKKLKCYDAFEREPFVVRVTSTETYVHEFALIALHTRADDVINELNHLPEVVDSVMKKWDVKNVVILGDLNAGCDHVKPDDWSKVKLRNDPAYTWLIDDDVDTTVSNATSCAYDRFIVRGQQFLDAIVPDSAKIYNFLADYQMGGAGDNETNYEDVSDHFPIQICLKKADGTIPEESCDEMAIPIDELEAAKAAMKAGDEVKGQDKETPSESEETTVKEEL